MFVKGSLKSADEQQVKWCLNHAHKNPVDTLIGFVYCEARDEGVYGYGFLNQTPNALIVREQLRHGELTDWSIFVDEKNATGKNINMARLREVSAVTFGGNPSAKIIYLGSDKFLW
jgi:HK97 family phage prohead protease